MSVLAQLCNFIPGHLVGKLAREHGVGSTARTFGAWSHVVGLLYGQLTHTIGLNDICDGLRHHVGWLARIRGATPSRNGFSHANKVRGAGMAEKLFWSVLEHLRNLPQHPLERLRASLLTKQIPSKISAVDHVVSPSLILDSQRSCHSLLLSSPSTLSIVKL